MRIISGHQPVYLPWLGLFHKYSLCDEFVYMDTVQYLEQDWNNRNKIRIADGWQWLSVPIDRKRSGSFLHEVIPKGVDDPHDRRFWQKEHWKAIEYHYRKAPYFQEVESRLAPLYLETVWERLVDLCFAQFNLFLELLEMKSATIVRMSERVFEGSKDDLILDQVLKLKGDAVVLGSHGRDYLDVHKFSKHHIHVYFQDYIHPCYEQRYRGFEPQMSIIDLLFLHGPRSREILLSGNIGKEDLLSLNLWETGDDQ